MLGSLTKRPLQWEALGSLQPCMLLEVLLAVIDFWAQAAARPLPLKHCKEPYHVHAGQDRAGQSRMHRTAGVLGMDALVFMSALAYWRDSPETQQT